MTLVESRVPPELGFFYSPSELRRSAASIPVWCNAGALSSQSAAHAKNRAGAERVSFNVEPDEMAMVTSTAPEGGERDPQPAETTGFPAFAGMTSNAVAVNPHGPPGSFFAQPVGC
jgi:hypothetical protein